MKITHIQTSNFLGARAVDLALTKPVVLIAGKNGAGKSSIQEAVRMALTSETVRVGLKKDYPAMISEGADSGFAEVATADGAYSVVLPSGKGNHGDIAALPYILDAQRFARMDDKERRQFLFGLMGVKMDGSAIKERLTAKETPEGATWMPRNCDAQKVEQVRPILRAGFDAASKEASAKAREAKASWKTATGGETWGKDKAEKWQPAPLPDGADRAAVKVESIKKSIAETEAALSEANQSLGVARAEIKRRESGEARRLELKVKADQAERIQARLNHDTAELSAWEERVADFRARAGVVQPNPNAPGEYLLRGLAAVTADFVQLTTEYPDVSWPDELLNRSAAHLAEFRKLHGDPVGNDSGPDPEAVAKLPEYEKALALMQSAVANGKRDLDAANAAQAEYDRVVAEQDSVLPDVAGAEAKAAELAATLKNWRADLEKYADMARQAAGRAALIDQVAKLHQDVLDWSHIADALAPDGIPGELLAEALGPINSRLFASSGFAEWEVVAIGADMSITYGGRDYALISESEKWRTDAMIAEAVSHLAGIKLLVLDRFDVLDLKGREDLLYWLDGMATDGDIDTALIFGTLKSLPALNFETIEAHWIENGAAGQLKEAA